MIAAGLCALALLQTQDLAFTFEPIQPLGMRETRLAVSEALKDLPQYEGGARMELLWNGLPTGMVVPRSHQLRFLGMDGKKNTYFSVQTTKEGDFTIRGARPIFSGANGFESLPLPTKDTYFGLEDVNQKGDAVFVVETPTAPKKTFSLKQVPNGYLFKDGKWTNFGRATSLRIDDQGNVAGITEVEGMTDKPRKMAFTFSGEKLEMQGDANTALMSPKGETLFFSWSEGYKIINEVRRLRSAADKASIVSQGKRRSVTIVEGDCPVAFWAEGVYVAKHWEDINPGDFFLVIKEQRIKLNDMSQLPPGCRVMMVGRPGVDGSLVVGLTDGRVIRYGFLRPNQSLKGILTNPI